MRTAINSSPRGVLWHWDGSANKPYWKKPLSSISFLIYLLSHSLPPLKPTLVFLCLATSLQIYYSLLRCCISPEFILWIQRRRRKFQHPPHLLSWPRIWLLHYERELTHFDNMHSSFWIIHFCIILQKPDAPQVSDEVYKTIWIYPKYN